MFRKKQQQISDPSLSEGMPILQDLFIPDCLEERSDSLMLGANRYCRVFAISLWPRDVYVGWLDEIFSVGDTDLSIYIDPMKDRTVIKDLTDRVVSAQSQWLVEKNRGTIARLPELENVIHDLEAIREAIACNRDRMFHVTVLITVHGESEDDLNARCDALEGILARKSTYIRVLVFQQKSALKNVLPLYVDSIASRWVRRNLTTGGVAAMLPVNNTALSHPSGIFVGFTVTGSPVFFDPFIGSPLLPNPHMAVFGYTGTGKSVTLKVLLSRFSLLGIRGLCLDLEGEYTRTVEELCDGEVITIEPGAVSGINPLEIRPEYDEISQQYVINISDKVADIRALISTAVQNFANRSLDAKELAVLEEAIREEYAARGITSKAESLYESGGVKLEEDKFAAGKVIKKMPTLSDLHFRLSTKPGTENLCLILKPFLRGNTLGMFDCETTVDLHSPVVSFNLAKINDEFTRFFSMFVILSWAWQEYAMQKNTNKLVFVDEAWQFMQYPESAHFLETLARRGRKHRTGLVIASQLIEEFISRAEGRSIIANCATQVFLGQSSTVVDQVAEVFHLPSGVRDRLEIFRNGECLWTMGGNTSQLQVAVLPYESQYVMTTGGIL